METVEQIMTNLGATIERELKSEIMTKKVTRFGAVNASGKLAKSIRFEADKNGVRVFANDYFYYLENGRKPGKRPPRNVIKEWLQVKGIKPQGKITLDSLAFLIQRKIGEKGTIIHQQGGSRLLEDVVTKELIDNVKVQLMMAFRNNFVKAAFSNVIKNPSALNG